MAFWDNHVLRQKRSYKIQIESPYYVAALYQWQQGKLFWALSNKYFYVRREHLSRKEATSRFPLISIPGAQWILKIQSSALIGRRSLKEGGVKKEELFTWNFKTSPSFFWEITITITFNSVIYFWITG